jgi:dTDP-L-rhamnose 4-epimerase
MKPIKRVLVTGGAGFIGSFTVELLIEKGYEVTVLDSLEPQVHPNQISEYLDSEVITRGDVRNRDVVKEVFANADAIIHLAAAVGVGQSMYEVEKYVDYNVRGTAVLLDLLAREKNNIKKVVVASSMSVYGEGKYYCNKCGQDRFPDVREPRQLEMKSWDFLCPACQTPLNPVPTDEKKPSKPTSIYAMTKRDQEEMCLLVGKTYGIPTVALRYFNAYGPRQSLSNPYTGVCAIFVNRILNNLPPHLFEDGKQLRDFVHVKDVARANILALEQSSANYEAINIGSGEQISIKELAESLIEICQVRLKPLISHRYRSGDIRHCYADISKARNLLSYTPTIQRDKGLRELVEWAKLCGWAKANVFENSLKELRDRRLIS